jgi:RNA polymerase sigma factor (sigma-70 family)
MDTIVTIFNNPLLGLQRVGFIQRGHKVVTTAQYIPTPLLERYLPLMETISARFARKVGADDPLAFLSGAMIGLKEVCDRYPPTHKGFERLAKVRIRQRVIDQIREEGIYRRSDIEDLRTIAQAEYDLHEQGDIRPSDENISERAGIDVGRLRQMRDKTGVAHFSALQPEDSEHDSVANLLPSQVAHERTTDETDGDDIRVVIDRFGVDLSPMEKRVIARYYFGKSDITMAEIGARMRKPISESRVSQILTAAIDKIIDRMIDANTALIRNFIPEERQNRENLRSIIKERIFSKRGGAANMRIPPERNVRACRKSA